MSAARRGMTLLEVTIGLLVIGLLAAIATPRFTQTLTANQLSAAASRIASTIEYVRHVALNDGRTTTIVFDASTDKVTSTDVDAVTQAGSSISIDLKSEYDDSIELTASFDGQDTLSFDLEGAPIVGSTAMQSGTITLTSDSQSRTLYVLPGLGGVSFTAPSGGSPSP
ncbi:GspH/FimT family pseudopilin [Stieleria varia]|uniref:Type II secretion system protein H n=2 Tax=Stieleria varia TaxID=2528005 RepID=A0A5C6B8C1_9BACT|nr:hypothetical protein Pla52n_01120 [Stieleria varia]